MGALLTLVLVACGGSGDDDIDNTINNNNNTDNNTPSPPSQATLSFPEKDKACTEGDLQSDTQTNLEFRWNASDNTDTYDLTVTNLTTLEKVESNGINGTSKSLVLNHDVAYSWQITSKSSNSNQTANSEVWNFYLAGVGEENYIPFPAAIVAPKYGETIQLDNGKVNLSWAGSDPDQDTLSYTVYLDIIDGNQEPQEALRNLSETQVEVELENDVTYFWRVKSSDGNNSSFSIVYKFTTTGG